MKEPGISGLFDGARHKKRRLFRVALIWAAGFGSGVFTGKPEADAANDGDDSYHDDPHHSSTLHARTSAKASE